MRVALFDVDSKIPNLALMKLSRHHREAGDDVVLYDPLWSSTYDRIYASKIFKFSDGGGLDPSRMIIGGTGSGSTLNLAPEIERLQPDYNLYNYPHNIGFAMRGCRFRCKFCVVPEKEGGPVANNSIEDIWQQRDSDFVVLLDNDFFGNPEWADRIAEILKHNLRVSFSQGLNIRIITEEQAAALASVRFRNLSGKTKQVHFAWDQWGKGTERLIDEGFSRVVAAGVKPREMAFFVLIGWHTTEEQDLYRINKLHDKGADVFVMPYDKADPYQKALTRWKNAHLWRMLPWADYESGAWKGRWRNDYRTRKGMVA
jgi:organic radical activating enzyme